MIRNGDREMEFIGGIVALRGGIDGIALGPDWLYYGALSGSGLYRVRLRDLQTVSCPPDSWQIAWSATATSPSATA